MSVCHPNWRDHAACRGMDPALFYPERGASTREAEATCAGCPVQADCLTAALERPEKGIWGGVGETARRRLRRVYVAERVAS